MRERAERLAIPVESLRDYLRADLPSASDEAFDYWFAWLLEPDQDEETLRGYLLRLVSQLHRAASVDNFEAVRGYLRIYDFGYRYCRNEPFLTAYEYHLMQCYLLIASMHFVAGRLPEFAADRNRIGAALRHGDQRRAGNGVGYRPGSELRLSLIGTSAELLSDPDYEGVVSQTEVERLATGFWSIADSLVQRLTRVSEESQAGYLMTASFWEMKVCKLAYLSDNSLFLECVSRFNQRYKADLVASVDPNIRGCKQLRTGWFWDMEIWKLIHSSEWDEDLLLYARKQRSSLTRLTYSELAAPGNEVVWLRQESSLRKKACRNKADFVINWVKPVQPAPRQPALLEH